MAKKKIEEAAEQPQGMAKAIYQDLDEKTRKAKLQSVCDKAMSYTYKREYTDEELAAKKSELAELSIKISDLEAELRSLKAQYKELISPREADREVIVADLRRGGEDVTEECYAFVDFNIRKAGIYNAAGILIREEDIDAEMEQATIFQMLREEPEVQDQPEPETALLPESVDEKKEDDDKPQE